MLRNNSRHIGRRVRRILKRLRLGARWAALLPICALGLSACQSLAPRTLVSGGKSDYLIVVPVEASPVDNLAAHELQHYCKAIFDVEIPVVEDSSRERSREILIGATRRLETALAISRAQELDDDGFSLQTIGEKLVIVGGQEKGTLYGVYTFLETYLGCRKYTSKIDRIPKLETFELPTILDTQVPFIKFRDTHYRDTNDPAFTVWHKIDHDEHGGHPEWGSWCHTFGHLVPAAKYFEAHPEYFSLVNGRRSPEAQLCLTNPDVLRITVEQLKKDMAEKPEAKYWSVSQNDTQGYCECEKCSAIDEREGTHMGSLLWFVNRVAAEFPDKVISTLAYQYSRSAPKNIKPAGNVNFMLCSIECNRSKPIATDPESASFVKDVEDWAKLTDNILVWDYVVQFQNLVSPFPNLRVLQPNIQLFVKNNTRAMFQQGNREIGGEWCGLRAYLIAKLLWNPDADVNALMDDYLEGVYGKAGPILREYIDLMHGALEESGANLEIFGNPYTPVDGYLAPELMDRYAAILDRAAAAAEDDATRAERVAEARLPLEYALLEQGKHYGTKPRGLYRQVSENKWEARPEMRQRLEDFVALCNKTGVTRLKEWNTTPDDYLADVNRLFEIGMQSHLALGKPVALSQAYSERYTAGGDGALTDGLRGTTDYQCNWQGFEGIDVTATIDLEKPCDVSSVRGEFLQEIRSWIFMPKRMACSVSLDGKTFEPVGEAINTVSDKEKETIIHPLCVEFSKRQARYVRVEIEGLKQCPLWHMGAGGKAWTFVDEIIVE